MTEYTNDELRGKKIFTTDGKTVGEIVRFEIDPVLWKVRSLVVEVTDAAMEYLELKKSLMRRNEILVGKELIKSVGDVVNLNVTLPVLKMQLATPTSKKQVIAGD